MNELIEYIKNPTSDDSIFNLGLYYESINQYSAAASFYLKCAELTNHTNFRYECLLRLYLCLNELKDRNHTCEHILKQAIALCPNYGIAYFFLTQIYEIKEDWSSVYLFASLGLQQKDNISFVSNFNYCYYSLYFQKAAAAWWIGKADESRLIYQYILNTYINDLDESYKKLLESNLCSLGSGKASECMHTYTAKDINKLIYSFPGIQNIQQNFSQVYQDLFVLSVLDGKIGGTYLEIGSAEPFYGSNTALLETQFGWTGVGVEYDRDKANMHSVRKNPVICTDATQINYESFLAEHFINNTIDYLQLDIEPSSNTYLALTRLPFDKYKFNVITYEHDHYIDISKSYRQKSREYLKSLGYILLVNDVSPRENCSFEDWWIHPDLIQNTACCLLANKSQKNVNWAPDILLHH